MININNNFEITTNLIDSFTLQIKNPISIIALAALSFAIPTVTASKIPTLFQKNTKLDQVALAAMSFFKKQCPYNTAAQSLVSDLFFTAPMPLDRRETELQELLGPEILRLDPKDPRPKLLFLLAEDDPNNSSAISKIYTKEQIDEQFENDDEVKQLRTQVREGSDEAGNIMLAKKNLEELLLNQDFGIAASIKFLDVNSDVRFKIIKDPEELCTEIEAASKTGDLKSVILTGHGFDIDNEKSYISITSTSLLYSSYPDLLSHLNMLTEELTPLSERCFSKLAPDATIILNSCSSGKFLKGIAGVLSRLSKKIVYAPKGSPTANDLTFSQDVPPIPKFMIKKTFYNENLLI